MKWIERFDDELAYIAPLIFLAGTIVHDVRMDKSFREFCEDVDVDCCFGELRTWMGMALDGPASIYSLREWFLDHDRVGFLARFHTPVVTPRDDIRSVESYSWAHTTHAWVYGDTLKQALDAGFSWVAEQRKTELRQFSRKERP